MRSRTKKLRKEAPSSGEESGSESDLGVFSPSADAPKLVSAEERKALLAQSLLQRLAIDPQSSDLQTMSALIDVNLKQSVELRRVDTVQVAHGARALRREVAADQLFCAALDSAGGVLYCAGKAGVLYAYDANSLECRERQKLEFRPVCALELLSNGAVLAVAGNSKQILLFKTNEFSKGPFARLCKHAARVNALCAIEDTLFSGSDDCSIVCWDVATASASEVEYGHVGPVLSLGKTAGGQLVSGGADNSVRFWNWQRRKHAILNCAGHVDCVASCGGKHLLAGPCCRKFTCSP